MIFSSDVRDGRDRPAGGKALWEDGNICAGPAGARHNERSGGFDVRRKAGSIRAGPAV